MSNRRFDGFQPILYEEDYDLYPTAVFDWNTSNKSFLRLHKILKVDMGIKNNKFFLVLLQKDLIGVDPYSKDLTEKQKWMIQQEAKYNPWYVFRELIRIPTNGPPLRFKANRGNIALYWSFFNHIDFGLLQPRQTGKSVSTDCLNIGIMFIWGESTTIQLITKDSKLRDANVKRLKEMRDLLPKYIFETDRNDADTKDLLTAIIHGNMYGTSVARNDVAGADKLGRGLTVPIMHFDELAYIKHIGKSLPVALASGSAARLNAKNAGQPYGNVYTTTAGDITTDDGKYAHDFMTAGAVWTETWYDLKDQDALRKVIRQSISGKKMLIYGSFNHRQLGKTDEWLYNELAETNQHGEIADRDFFNIWTVGGEGSPLTLDEKKILRSSAREPNKTEITDENYTIRWYIPEHQIESRMASSKFIMGVDPSELLGKDNDATGMVIIDVETHDVIAVGRYNETSIVTMANFFANLLIRFPNILWVPERKSTGSTFIDFAILALVRAGQDPFKRIFNRIVDEHTLFPTEYAEIQTPMSMRMADFYDRYKRYFGYATSGTGRYSRNALFKESLSSSIQYGGRRAYDSALIEEYLGLVIRNGRIDHKANKHDDLVVSQLLCHWVAFNGQNLSYYGIPQGFVFSKAKVSDVELTNLDKFKIDKEQRERDEFESLMTQLSSESNPMVAMKIELRLRSLARRVNMDENSGVGIDAILKQVKDERTRRFRSARFSNGSSHGEHANRSVPVAMFGGRR